MAESFRTDSTSRIVHICICLLYVGEIVEVMIFFIDDLIDVDSGFRISLADKLDFFPLCFLFVRSASVTMDFIVQLYYN